MSRKENEKHPQFWDITPLTYHKVCRIQSARYASPICLLFAMVDQAMTWFLKGQERKLCFAISFWHPVSAYKF